MILGTLAYKQPEVLSELLRVRGADKIVVASDYAEGKIVTGGWTTRQDVGVLEAAERFAAAGVVNLLATAVGRDGMAMGPDLKTMRALCDSNGKLRVIASGGHQERRRPRGDRARGCSRRGRRARPLRRRRQAGRREGGGRGMKR